MHRLRRSVKKVPLVESSSDSEDDVPLKKLRPSPKIKAKSPVKQRNGNDSSSSESDIENYLQPIHKVDLSSSFFNVQKKTEEDFDKIEKNMFSGITRLSDSSESEEDLKENPPVLETCQNNIPKASTSATKLNFRQLEDYTRKMEEAKKHVEKYNAKKKTEENNMDISHLLAAGEKKQITQENIKIDDLHSSDFESSEDDWEEVKIKDVQETKEKSIIPKDNLQITLNAMPNTCKKKKGVDLLAAMKRRLNRIRKENQVYVHKVHLLCWIAYGNFVNSAVSNSQILGLALSLIPSDKSYPSDRTDLAYLEQILQWYKRTIKLIEKPVPKELTLENALRLQISRKEAYDKKMLVLIFVAILRALGIQCRLVMSFLVEPLRPPASELHSLAKEAVAKKEKDAKNTLKRKNKSDEKPDLKKVDLPKSAKKNDSKEKIAKSTTNADNKATSSRSSRAVNKEKESIEKDNKSVRQNTLDKGKRKEESKSARKDKSKSTLVKEKSSNEESLRDIKKSTVKEKSSNKESLKDRKKSTVDKQKDLKKEHLRDRTHLTVVLARSKSSTGDKTKTSDVRKTRSKSSNDVIKEPSTVPQLDGLIDSSDEEHEHRLQQLDGSNDLPKKSSKTKKPNLRNLKSAEKSCPKNHPSRLKSASTKDGDSENDFAPSPLTKRTTPSPQKKQSAASYYSPPKRQADVKNDIINLIKGRIAEQKYVDRSRMVKKRKSTYVDDDSDSDYAPEPVKKKHHDSDSDVQYFAPKPKVKKRIAVKKEGGVMKIISDDSDLDEAGKKKKKGVNVWVEVFLEAEEKWITADVVKGQVHCVNELYTRAAHPVSYIVAWNNDNTLKDVTKRYCTNFSTVTRKLRVDPKWWDETLQPFLGKSTYRDKEEDDDLNRQQLDQPMPKAISEYKNHPLYALRRHLLKFEDIYPPDIVPLGYVRGEPIYPRNCVYVCKSRDIWLKDAKVVKPGEKPYKIVKARPRFDKLSNTVISDKMLEIFGPWQTMDYEPPTAENGIVPRNAFGNVELFKPCMLPKGTVHLKLPGLNKICKRMDIDCATAIVGFEFHGGWSVPSYDGFVVCEEFADTLAAAWEIEQEVIEKKENDKIEKRVYDNWKKLIKGLLIRERLKARYDFGNEGTSSGKEKKKLKKKSRVSLKKRRISSDSESEADAE